MNSYCSIKLNSVKCPAQNCLECSYQMAEHFLESIHTSQATPGTTELIQRQSLLIGDFMTNFTAIRALEMNVSTAVTAVSRNDRLQSKLDEQQLVIEQLRKPNVAASRSSPELCHPGWRDLRAPPTPQLSCSTPPRNAHSDCCQIRILGRHGQRVDPTSASRRHRRI